MFQIINDKFFVISIVSGLSDCDIFSLISGLKSAIEAYKRNKIKSAIRINIALIRYLKNFIIIFFFIHLKYNEIFLTYIFIKFHYCPIKKTFFCLTIRFWIGIVRRAEKQAQ